MNYHKRMDTQKQTKKIAAESPQPSPSTAGKPANTSLSRAMRQISSGNYEKALQLLRSAGSDPQVRNAVGVCLLRLGRFEDAMPLFRSIVLAPGCTWIRPNIPTVYKTNYATALLLGGHPSGCEEILAEIPDKTDPGVQRLTQAIRRWVNSLTFWQKMNWWVGRIEPETCKVAIDFPPGDLEYDAVLSGGGPSSAPEPTPGTAA